MKVKFKWNKYISEEDTVSKLSSDRGIAIVRQKYPWDKNWEYSAELFEIESEYGWVWDMDFNEGQEDVEILYWTDWYDSKVVVSDTVSDTVEKIEQ